MLVEQRWWALEDAAEQLGCHCVDQGLLEHAAENSCAVVQVAQVLPVVAVLLG